MSDLQYTNNQLHNTPGKAERVEVVNPIDIDLATIETEIANIKAEVERIRKGTIFTEDIASADITSAYGSVPLVSLNTIDDAFIAIKVRNTGGAPMDMKIVESGGEGSQIPNDLYVQTAIAAGTNALPLKVFGGDAQYDVYLRAASPTSARIEATVKA
jgi:hypothetical protein